MTRALLSGRTRNRIVLVIALAIVLMLTGTGVATARWIIAATTTTPVAAGALTTELTGTEGLGKANIRTADYTKPVALTLHNPNSVPVDYSLTFSPQSGRLTLAEIDLAVWKPNGVTCPDRVPSTGVSRGTLATPPSLQAPGVPGGSDTVVCAATKFSGTLFGSAGKTLTTTPTLTAHMTTGTWVATAEGTDFTHTMAPAPNQVTGLKCEDFFNGLFGTRGIRISWTPVPEATSYRITSPAGPTIPDTTATSVSLDTSNGWQGIPTGAYPISITALGPTGSSTAEVKTIRSEWVGLARAPRCP